MAHQFVVSMMYFVLSLFFFGLGGCCLVVVLSWIDILREGFTPDSPIDLAANDAGRGAAPGKSA